MKKASSANAIKHGITAKRHRSQADRTILSHVRAAFSGKSTDCRSIELAETIAEIQSALSAVRREKARIYNECLPFEKGDGQLLPVSWDPTRFARCVKDLSTLDDYERKLLSRRRGLCFSLLVAEERASKSAEG